MGEDKKIIELKKLAIISTHPIQYNAPVFKMLSARGNIKIKVFYTWGEGVLKNKFDPGFGKVIKWDIPLLEGYDFEMVENVAKNPGSHHFSGINNPNLIDMILRWEADALLVFGWSFKSHLAVLRYFHKKIPIYFRGDSTLLDNADNLIKQSMRRFFLKWIYRHIQTAFYVGVENKKYFLKNGMRENQLVFVPHAIDNDRFSGPTITNFRKKLNIDDSKIVLLFAGKFEHKKNPQLLLEAFINCNHKCCDLVFVGNGPIESDLHKTYDGITDEDLRSRIHFLDFQNQSQMPDVYQACDVFILPSQGPGETWGLAINEAMASSKAVLVSDKCGAAKDLVQAGKNGYIFESGNIDALVKKINLLIQEKENIKLMGIYSRQIIQHWSFHSICASIEQTIGDKH